MAKEKKLASDDPDMVGSMAALIRAGQRARKLAEDTGTPYVVVRDGKLVVEVPKPARTDGQPADSDAK